MPPSEGLKTLISCAMTESDGLREPVEMAVWYVLRAHLYSKSRRRAHATQPEGHEQLGTLHDCNEACMECKTRLPSGATRGPRNLSRGIHMVKAEPAMFCGTSESEGMLRGLRHGDDFVVIFAKATGGVRRVAHEALRSRTDRRHWLCEPRGQKLAGAEQNHQRQHRALRHGSRTRPVPCQENGGGTRLGRFQEHEDTSTEARSRSTLADREQQDFGTAGSNPLQKLHHPRCLPGSGQSGHIGISVVPQQTHASTTRGTHGGAQTVCSLSAWQSSLCYGVLETSPSAWRLGSRCSTTEMTIRRDKHLVRHVYDAGMHRTVQRGNRTLRDVWRSVFGHWHALSLGKLAGADSDRSKQRFVSGTRRDSAERTWREVETPHLWLQGHVALRCVAGIHNPADVLTKALTERQLRRRCEHQGQRSNSGTEGRRGLSGNGQSARREVIIFREG